MIISSPGWEGDLGPWELKREELSSNQNQMKADRGHLPAFNSRSHLVEAGYLADGRVLLGRSPKNRQGRGHSH